MPTDPSPTGSLWERLWRQLPANRWRAETAVVSLTGVRDEDKAEHADVRALSLSSGDRLLLASDGLWSHAADGQWWGPEDLEVGVKDLQALATQAIARGGRDNVTVVAVHLMK